LTLKNFPQVITVSFFIKCSGPGAVKLKIKRPLKTLTWWWQKGFFGTPEKLNKKEEFNDYGELSSYQLRMWVPHDVRISFVQHGTTPPFSRDLGGRKGPYPYTERVGSLLINHLLITHIGDAVDTLKIDGCEVADVFRVPSNPVLFPENHTPKVFFPAAILAPHTS